MSLLDNPVVNALFINNPIASFLNQQNALLLAPEAILLATLLFGIFQALNKSEKERQDTWWLSFLGLMFAFACLVMHFLYLYLPDLAHGRILWLNRPVFFGMVQADLFTLTMRAFLVLGALITQLFTKQYIDKRSPVPGEFYLIMLSALIGGMLLVGVNDLIMLFVALETLGIASYIMAGYLRGDLKSMEAALKYLVYGGVSTAILLFGFSLLYGFTKSTQFGEIAIAMRAVDGFAVLFPVIAILILAGFAFKLSAAPFHMWTPDVYEGAPTPVTAFLSVVSKTAGFAITLRFLYAILSPIPGWFVILASIASLSMVIGNVMALTQTNIKRLLAYSTIAHAGYILLGMVAMSASGISSVIYYLLTYVFMNLGAFACVTYFSNLTGGSEAIADYAGLAHKRPGLALVFTLFLISLAGLPVTAGFFAKFFLFQAIAAQGMNHLWIVMLALLASTVALYYYLNLIRLMVVCEPSAAVERLEKEGENKSEKRFSAVSWAINLCLFGTIMLGIFADPMMKLSNLTVQQMILGMTQQGLIGQVPASEHVQH